MKTAVRRRLAFGALATSGALVAGLVVAPSAFAGSLSVSPSAVATNTTQTLTFNSTEADQRYGAQAIFTPLVPAATFTASIAGSQLPVTASRSGTSSVDFTDLGNGLGVDGPADVGSYQVTLTGAAAPFPGAPGGGGTDSCPSCFTITPNGALTVASISPTSLRPNNGADVTVLGTGFTRGSTLQLLKGGSVDTDLTVGAPTGGTAAENSDKITTATQLRRHLTVGSGATPGPRDVRVLNPNGTSATLNAAFTVAGAALTSINPAGGDNAPTTTLTTLTVNGPSVADGVLTLEFLGAPGSASRQSLTIPTTRVSRTSTSITATADLSNAAPGVYQPVVRATDGTVNACDSTTSTGCRFTVVQSRTPTATALDETGDATGKSQPAGTSRTFDVTGTNFSKGAAVTVSGTGITTTAVEFVSPTLLRATLSSTAAAATGNRDVTVTLTDGKTATCTGCYTVTAASTPSPSPSATGTATIPPGRYVGLSSPVRVLDTRDNGGSVRRGEIVLDLSSRITDANATAAVLNVTITNPTARGFLVAYPTGTTRPPTSNVNFERNQTQANEVTVRLPASRKVSLLVDSASAHVIADLVGSFTTTNNAGGQVVTQAPTRVFDSRQTSTPKRTGEVVVSLPQVATGTVDVILNVTVTGSTTSDPKRGRGFVVAYATGTQRPGTSNVNFDAGQQQANEVITRVGTGSNARNVSLFIDSTRVGLIVDLVGYVIPTAQSGSQVFTPLASPVRALDTRKAIGTSGTSRVTGDLVLTLPSSVPSGATAVVLNVTATNGTNRGFVTVYPTGAGRPNTSNVNFPVNLTQANEAFSGINGQRQVTLFVGGAGSPSAHLIADVVGYLTPGPGAPAASGSPSASTSARPSGSAAPSPTGSPAAQCLPGTPLCLP